MTQSERQHIDSRFDQLADYMKKQGTEIAEIKRGVYGDATNKVPGLIDTDKSQHERIKSLEDTRKKVLYWGSGILVTLELFWHWLTNGK